MKSVSTRYIPLPLAAQGVDDGIKDASALRVRVADVLGGNVELLARVKTCQELSDGEGEKCGVGVQIQ